MLRMKLGVSLFVFFGLVITETTAQDIPYEARKMVAQNIQGPFIVFREAVQEDLKLTDEQKEKLDDHLREVIPEAVQFFPKLHDMKGEEREREHKAFRQKMQEKLKPILKETLKEDQSKRLRQLELQQEGAFALWHGDAEIRNELRVTDEQRKQFMPIVQNFQQQVGPLIKEAQSTGNHEEIHSKVMKIRKEQEGKIEAILTETQKNQWKEMLGKPLAQDD